MRIINANDKSYQITMIIYALQALGLLVGLTFFIALIVNYVKRASVQGTYLESHFTWQIRTFWYAVLWGIIGGITLILLIGYFILILSGIWVIYRIVKGWIYLYEKRPMYNNYTSSNGPTQPNIIDHQP